MSATETVGLGFLSFASPPLLLFLSNSSNRVLLTLAFSVPQLPIFLLFLYYVFCFLFIFLLVWVLVDLGVRFSCGDKDLVIFELGLKCEVLRMVICEIVGIFLIWDCLKIGLI